MPDVFQQALSDIARAPLVAKKATATVEQILDDKRPNFVGYRITGPTIEVVELAASRRLMDLEDRPGYGQFLTPRRLVDGTYETFGWLRFDAAPSIVPGA